MLRLLPLPVLGLLASSLFAQPLITDRPDFTESGVVVPLGSVQLEAGATWTRTGDDEVSSGPEALVRWAPFQRVEFRFGLPDYSAGDVEGWGDASLGTKIQVGPSGAWDVAAIVEASLPTGDDALSSGRIDPLLILIAGRDVGPVGIGMQGEVNWSEDGLGQAATLVAGLGLNDWLGTFLEAAISVDPKADAALILHHGYTFLLTPTLQFDIHAGIGLTEAAPDGLIGAGLSVRR